MKLQHLAWTYIIPSVIWIIVIVCIIVLCIGSYSNSAITCFEAACSRHFISVIGLDIIVKGTHLRAQLDSDTCDRSVLGLN